MAKERENQLTAEYARTILNYDFHTGTIRWRERSDVNRTWNLRYAGKIAGTEIHHGYVSISINKKLYLAHRLAWLLFTGFWPQAEIDHIDGDPTNNAIANLREATHAENGRNVRVNTANTSGCKGVSWHSQRCKWRAYIKVDGRQISLGLHDEKADAVAAYLFACVKYHGEFARLQ